MFWKNSVPDDAEGRIEEKADARKKLPPTQFQRRQSFFEKFSERFRDFLDNAE